MHLTIGINHRQHHQPLHPFKSMNLPMFQLQSLRVILALCVANVNRWQQQLGLSQDSCDQIDQYVANSKIGDHDYLVVSLSSERQNLVIFWLSINTVHFFIKVSSNQAIQASLFHPFIQNQPWNDL